MTKKTPPVRSLQILSLCEENWDAMAPTQDGRHCGTCQQNVFDLTSLTETEAGTLLARTGAKACVRMRVNEANEPIFAQERKPLKRLLPLVFGASLLAACHEPAADVRMGEVPSVRTTPTKPTLPEPPPAAAKSPEQPAITPEPVTPASPKPHVRMGRPAWNR